MNQKLVEGAMAMLARVIPPEEYKKANTAIGKIVELLETIDARAKRTEEAALYSAKTIADLAARVDTLEAAASVDSETFKATRAELALWLVPGSTEKALAPAAPGALNNDN